MTAVMESERSEARVLEWDSDFWGVTIAQADSARAGFAGDCMWLLLDAGDIDQIHFAEDRGFRLMDVRVTLERPASTMTYTRALPVVPADVEALAAIARTAHRSTRFYADPRFDRERCDDLYEGWLRNSVNGWADRVLRVGLPGAPLGYVTVHLDGDAGSIGLIAVAEHARGRGNGVALVRGALTHAARAGARSMSVVTQGRNVAALRCFEACGCRVVQMQVWMHKWAGR